MFTVCCTCVLGPSCVISGRDDDWAVGAVSRFVIFTLSVWPFIRATDTMFCVIAVVHFFKKKKNLANLTVVLHCCLTFEDHVGALCTPGCLCDLRRGLHANVLKCSACASCDKQLVETGSSDPWMFLLLDGRRLVAIVLERRHGIFGDRIFVHFGTHRFDSHVIPKWPCFVWKGIVRSL